MGKTAGEIYYDMEEYENNLAIETLHIMHFDKIINPYKKSKKIVKRSGKHALRSPEASGFMSYRAS